MVTPQEIERVQTQEVRDVLWAYKEYYFLDRPELGPIEEREYRVCGCGPETGEWPHNHGLDGTPLVCEAHEWRAKQAALQSVIVSAGLSMPIPKFVARTGLAMPSAVTMYSNPLFRGRPYLWIPQPTGKRSGNTAASAARWLYQNDGSDEKSCQEHIVFFVHHTQALTMCYERREQEVRDVLLLAPVLVYWHNRDGRDNGWVKQLVQARQYGLAFIVEE